jgi:hypothetical protein
MDEELVHETDNKATSPGDQNGIGDGTPHEQEQSTLTKDPLRSEVTLAKMRALFSRGNVSEAGALAYTYARQSREEKQQSEREAQAHTRNEDSADYEEEDDDEEFAQEEQAEVEPDQIFTITAEGNPAKTAGLNVLDLIRRGETIEEA